MHNTIKYFKWCLPVLVALLFACNPTRDRWLNRKWHTLTGHYNVYFNGLLKFNETVEGYEKGTPNDFSKVLPVFILPDEAAAKGMTSSMDEVIKKASKSIQLHTIGSYTDDSYFLMAKAQYYKGDYFAALETFQYINTKYPKSELKKECTAWIALCYDGMKKLGEAEAVMGLLISDIAPTKLYGKKKIPEKFQQKIEKLTPAQLSFVYATAAHIYVKQEKYNLAAERLKKALESTRTKPHKIRYNYILGQLYLMQDSVAAAKKCFSSVVKLLPPYDFEFNANLNLTKTYDPKNKSEVKQVKNNLKRMLRDDKNQGYFDQIYFELAKVEHRDNDIVNAIKHYQLSVATSAKNQSQKTQSYLALGDIYLAKPDYILGQAYYDSAAAVIPQEDKNYKKVQDKKNVLSELIENILTIQTEDSLQRLSKLSKQELEKKVDGWIAAKKQKEEQDAKNAALKKQLDEQAALNKPIGGPAIPTPTIGGAEQGQWYFYNPSVLSTGQQEFFSARKWGRRENEDFWRIAAKEKLKSTGTNSGEPSTTPKDTVQQDKTTPTTPLSEEPKPKKPNVSEDRAEWVKNIPYTKEEVEKSTNKIINAYYNLGGVYGFKILDFAEANKSYSTLLSRFPDNEFEPEVWYNMYKFYLELKQPAKAEEVKQRLISKYPENKYALILQNKAVQSVAATANKEVVAAYENLYQLYLAGSYKELKAAKLEADKKHSGNVMQAKFDLLYALAVGKTDSLGAFKTELVDITKAYPKTDVAERAAEILKLIETPSSSRKDTVVQEPEFKLMNDAPHYYVFATRADKFDMNDLLQKLISYNEEYHQLESLRANSLLSSDGYQLLYVREFKQLEDAVKYLNGLKLTSFYKGFLPGSVNYVEFAVPTDVFKKLMKDKKVDAYHTFFAQQLPTLLKQIKP